MVDYLENRNGCFCGNLLFIREVQNWELEYMVKLLDNVYTTKLHHREEDKLEWMPSKTQCFQVKSYYKELRLNPFSLTDYLESSCTTKGGFFHMV